MKKLCNFILRNLSVLLFVITLFHVAVVFRHNYAVPTIDDFESKIGECVMFWLVWNIPILLIMAFERNKVKKYWLTNILNSVGMIIIPYFTAVIPIDGKIATLYRSIDVVSGIIKGYGICLGEIWAPGQKVIEILGIAVLGGALIVRVAVIFVILINIFGFTRTNVYGTVVLRFPVINIISCGLFEIGYLWLISQASTLYIFVILIVLEGLIFLCGVSESSKGIFGMKKDILTLDYIKGSFVKLGAFIRSIFTKETYTVEYLKKNGFNIVLLIFSIAGIVIMAINGKLSYYSYALSAALGILGDGNASAINSGYASIISVLQFLIPIFFAAIVGAVFKNKKDIKVSSIVVALFSYVMEMLTLGFITEKVYGVAIDEVLSIANDKVILNETLGKFLGNIDYTNDTNVIMLLIFTVIILAIAIVFTVWMVGALIFGTLYVAFQFVDYLMMITYFVIVYFFVSVFNPDYAMCFVNPLTIILLNYILCKIAVNLNESLPKDRFDFVQLSRRGRN